MLERIQISDLSIEEKKLILKELDYDSDDVFVLDKEGNEVIDPYINQPVKIDNMVILPGNSVLVLDNNPLSIVSYLEDNPDVKLF